MVVSVCSGSAPAVFAVLAAATDSSPEMSSQTVPRIIAVSAPMRPMLKWRRVRRAR